MKDFILQPWEYQGATFNPRAQAETRLDLGGKKRNFLLKLHEGVLYFKEPSRSQVFAIPLIYEDSLATDSIGLISAFQRETATGNYGALVVKRDYFPKLPVRGQFILLVCADGTGWMREHFDPLWFDLPEWDNPPSIDLWNDDLEVRTRPLLPFIKDSLLQRTVEPEIREAEAPHWLGGTAKEFTALIQSTHRLFLSFSDFSGSSYGGTLFLKMKSCSAFAAGEGGYVRRRFKNGRTDDFPVNYDHVYPQYADISHLLGKHFRFIGVNWSEGGEMSDYSRLRVERVFQAGLEEWGENWRGNWAPQRASLEVPIPDLTHQSAHEKLEAALLLRHWLQDKMPAPQIDELFQSVDLR